MAKYKLGDICEIVSGSTPKTGIDEYWDGDVKWITPAELNDDTYIINDSVRKITELAVKKTGLSPFPEGTVILSSRAPIGKVAIAGCKMYCNQGFKNLICSEKINNKYLYWFLKSNTDYLKSLGRGATFKEISKGIVSEIEINVPEIRKQVETVAILEKVSEVIALRKQELGALDNLIKARFVEMFGDPIYSDKYGTRKLSSCVANKADMVDGPFGSQVNTKVDYIEDGEIPVIRTVNVKMMSFSSLDLKYMTREKYETVIRSQVLPGDVILTKVGTIGNVCIFPNFYKEAVLSTTGSCRIRVDNSIVNTVFFAYNLMYLKSKLLEIASAGVQPFLNMNHVKNINILDVPLDKQIEFADFVHQVDKSKVAVQKALDETKLLFDSLMQKYFG